jgi:hypothetical protein
VYCALQVSCQSALPVPLHKTILCGPMSILTTKYISLFVVCSLYTSNLQSTVHSFVFPSMVTAFKVQIHKGVPSSKFKFLFHWYTKSGSRLSSDLVLGGKGCSDSGEFAGILFSSLGKKKQTAYLTVQ